jgi:hypothetical protein
MAPSKPLSGSPATPTAAPPKLYDRRDQEVLLEDMERNAELGILQSIFRSASRRETLGKHSKGWSPRRWAKNGLDKTAGQSVTYVY